MNAFKNLPNSGENNDDNSDYNRQFAYSNVLI